MKQLRTLVPDIYELVTSGKGFVEEDVILFGINLSKKLANRLSEERGQPSLRMSNLGKPCVKELWYGINAPELAEPLSGPTRLKFLLGDIWEELVLFLARASGHTVTDEQKEVTLHGVKGHIDGKVDGVTVDVKSASPYSFKKFREHLNSEQDAFGYIPQLGGYLEAENETKGAFIAADKTLGHLWVDEHDKPDIDFEKLIRDRREILSRSEPPERPFKDEPEGKSGNRKLGIKCSYCAYKSSCWPGLRTFLYSGKPVHLTHVEREPRVDEVKGSGKASED